MVYGEGCEAGDCEGIGCRAEIAMVPKYKYQKELILMWMDQFFGIRSEFTFRVQTQIGDLHVGGFLF
jgi:hypothetical protein